MQTSRTTTPVAAFTCLAMLTLLSFVFLPVHSNAAPPTQGSSSSQNQSATSSDRIPKLAKAMQTLIRSQGRDGNVSLLMKSFGVDSSAPATAYLADAEILDQMRSKPPLPGVSEAKQNEMLAQLYLTARMKGKGPEQVAVELDEILKYATGQKPLHELNLPEGSRGVKDACPHARCSEKMSKQGSLSISTRKYDQYLCPSGHETLLRTN